MTSIDGVVHYVQKAKSPIAIMMVGAPGSGKSRVVGQLHEALSIPVFSSDACRKEISGDENNQSSSRAAWELVYLRATNALLSGQSVIIDGTHNNMSGRMRDIQRYVNAGATAVVAVWVDTPLRVTLRRNKQRARVVPDEVIRRMHSSILRDPPSVRNGFRRVFRIA